MSYEVIDNGSHLQGHRQRAALFALLGKDLTQINGLGPTTTVSMSLPHGGDNTQLVSEFLSF